VLFIVAEWDAALSLPESDFAQKYNFPKPKFTDNVVLCSRTSERRAMAAAEKSIKVGYKR
jgi:hypothetical protein